MIFHSRRCFIARFIACRSERLFLSRLLEETRFFFELLLNRKFLRKFVFSHNTVKIEFSLLLFNPFGLKL